MFFIFFLGSRRAVAVYIVKIYVYMYHIFILLFLIYFEILNIKSI